MTTTIEPMSATTLLRLSSELGRCELVRGELRQMAPAGFEHGVVIGNLTEALAREVRTRRLGVVSGAETGFKIASDPDTVRAPDIGFVRQERVRGGRPRGYFPGAPDLAVEVVSPGDSAQEVRDKVTDWLGAGAQAVWVVYPARQTVEVHEADGTRHTLGLTDQLTGGSVLPGFILPVAQIFE